MSETTSSAQTVRFGLAELLRAAAATVRYPLAARSRRCWEEPWQGRSC